MESMKVCCQKSLPDWMSVRSGQCPSCLLTNELLKGAYSWVSQDGSSDLSVCTRRSQQSQPVLATLNCLLAIDTVTNRYKPFSVSHSFSPNLQSLPDLIQANSVPVACSVIKSPHLDMTTELWSSRVSKLAVMCHHIIMLLMLLIIMLSGALTKRALTTSKSFLTL